MRTGIDLVIGLDLSLTGSGVVTMDSSGEIVFQNCAKSKPNPKITDIERFHQLSLDLLPSHFISHKTYVVIENYGYASSGDITRIAEFAGIVKDRLCFSSAGVLPLPNVFPYNLTTCAPTTLKKFLTGRGNCEKALVLKEVLSRWGKDFDDHNVADAFGLCLMGYLTVFERPDNLIQTQKDALKTYQKGLPLLPNQAVRGKRTK